MNKKYMWSKTIDAMYVATGLVVALVAIAGFFGVAGGYASPASCFEAAATIAVALVETLMLDKQWYKVHGRRLDK